MKKRILNLMMAVLLFAAPATVFAQEPTGTSNTVYTAVSECSDGGYWITTIEEEDTGIAAFADSTKKASKTTKYYNKNNVLQWYVTVNGTFSYVKGKSSTCTAASVTAVSKSSAWKIASKKASKSGSTATASATAKRYANNILMEKATRTVKLTCDKIGNLS